MNVDLREQCLKLMDSVQRGGNRDLSWLDRTPIRPVKAKIYLTELCNSRCRTCNFWKRNHEDMLDTESWKRMFADIRSVGISTVEFIGGEPTIRQDLPDLVKAAGELGFSKIRLSSNGLSLTDTMIEKLIQYGMNGLNISIDGLRDTYHYLRGVDGFERALQAASTTARAGISVDVYTNLTRQVIPELEAIVNIVEGIGAHWMANIVENMKYGFVGVSLDELAITSLAEIEEAISILARIRLMKPQACLLRDPDVIFIREFLLDPRREKSVPCALGFDDIYLDPRGFVYSACMSIKPVGRLLEEDLSEIIQSARMKANLKAMLNRECGGCTCGYPQRAELMYGRDGYE